MKIKQFLKRKEHVCNRCGKFILFPLWKDGLFNKVCDKCLKVEIDNLLKKLL